MTRKLPITCDKCTGPMVSRVHAVAPMRSSRVNRATTDCSQAERGGARSGQAPLLGGPLRRERSQPPRVFVGHAEIGAAWTNACERSHPSLAWASVTAGSGAAHGASSAMPRKALVQALLWTDRFRACRSPGRRTARPSGETTGR